MRTTVTIDADTELLIRNEVKRTGHSFKQVLNESVRRGLRPGTKVVSVEPLFTKPFPASLMRTNFNHLANEWEDGDALQELSKST